MDGMAQHMRAVRAHEGCDLHAVHEGIYAGIGAAAPDRVPIADGEAVGDDERPLVRALDEAHISMGQARRFCLAGVMPAQQMRLAEQPGGERLQSSSAPRGPGCCARSRRIARAGKRITLRRKR